jgi:hypothetical protein
MDAVLSCFSLQDPLLASSYFPPFAILRDWLTFSLVDFETLHNLLYEARP